MRKTREEIEKGAEDILALLRGEPGPFLDSGNSYFGVKQVNESMKDKAMETDLGGALITRAKMTYGEADELAARVDLTDFPEFLRQVKPSCYWEPKPDGRVFYGCVFWSIYSYLTVKEYICSMTPAHYGKGHPKKNGPESYDNTMEYLYGKVLERLVATGVFRPTTTDDRWFTFEEKT